MIQRWQKLKEDVIKLNYRTVLARTYKMPDGKEALFDIVESGVAVCVLALTKTQKVILAQQFRPGPDKILLELPGGGVEKGETPLEAIERELLEETGYQGNFQFVGTNYNSAYSTMLRHNFVATDCEWQQVVKLDEHEYSEPLEMTLADFRKHLRSGELTDVETGYLGLDFLNLL